MWDAFALQSNNEADAKARVLLTVSQIPKGRVSSFGRIADAAGFPRKARWVGRILSQLPSDTKIPWHRVLGHSGHITCPRKDLAQSRLESEGVEVQQFKVSMKRHVWPD